MPFAGFAVAQKIQVAATGWKRWNRHDPSDRDRRFAAKSFSLRRVPTAL